MSKGRRVPPVQPVRQQVTNWGQLDVPVRRCSTDFQQWLWWKKRYDRTDRWIALQPCPTNDRCDMADWFIDQYCPGFLNRLNKETDMLFPKGTSLFGRDDAYHYWLKEWDIRLSNIQVTIGVGDPFAEVASEMPLSNLHGYIHELHVEYYDAKGLFTSLYGGKGKAPAEWAGDSISKGARFNILKRDSYRCQLCGATAADGVKLHIDHVRPKAKGGSSFVWNLWVLCEPCNNGKRAREL